MFMVQWLGKVCFLKDIRKPCFLVIESNPKPYVTLSPNTNLKRKPNPLTLTLNPNPPNPICNPNTNPM